MGAETPAPLVRLAGASVLRGGRTILSGADFALLRGEHWAVLGGNGAGKTTLLRLLYGEAWPDDPDSRRYVVDGRACADPILFRQRARWASPEAAEDYRRAALTLTGLEAVLSGLGGGTFAYAAPTPSQRGAALGLLEELGAARLAEVSLAAVSEGQLRLILLLRAMAARPAALFLDEVLDGLDAPTHALAMAALERAAADGCQLVVAAHRAEDIPAAVNRVLLLEGGRIVGRGGRELLPLRRAAPASPPAAQAPGEPLWEVRNASVRLSGVDVLHGVSWTVRAGEHWAVTGLSGAGKSTLLKLAAGDLHPLPGGAVRRLGRAEGLSLWDIRKAVGLVSLDAQANYDQDFTILECVASGFAGTVGLRRPATDAELAAARALLARLRLEDMAGSRLGELSFGRRRLALILRAMVHGPRALLLDEPLTGLDAENRERVAALLRELAASGTTLVMVSHRPADLPGFVGLELRLENGRATHCGPRQRG